MRKSFLLLLSAGIMIVLFRLSGGMFSGLSLFPSYEIENVVSVKCPELDWELNREGGEWKLLLREYALPVRENIMGEILDIPESAVRHLAGRTGGDDNWLPEDSLTLIYADGAGEETVVKLYYDGTGSDSREGIFIGGKKGTVFFISRGFPNLFDRDTLASASIFPETLAGENINYYRLYTPREGQEAFLYRYEIIKGDSLWDYRGDIPNGSLKEDFLNLLLIRLAGLEGDLLLPGTEYLADKTRFRVEIRDNRGERYILNVGERKILEGTEYYLAQREGGDLTYAMTRERLSGIAPPLNSLLDF